jgi:protein involved in polysaccharide export with SLBB domain
MNKVCRIPHPQGSALPGSKVSSSARNLNRFLAALLLLFPLAVGTSGCAEKSFKAAAPVMAVSTDPVIPASYLIGAGDELEILYYIDPEVNVPEYRIDSEDTLRVDFFYYPVMTKTVSVRPDGYITLPSVGDIQARHKKPTDLAREISDRFRPMLAQPLVTVEVVQHNAKVEELKRAIYNQERGMSRLAVVRPDGGISLSYIGDVPAAGLTTHELQDRLHRRYSKIIYNLGATVVVLKAHSNRVYVMGEVERPNFYELIGPTTLSQVIATAGGFTRDAKSDQVIIVRRNKSGQPDAHIVYMHEIIGRDSLVDPLIQQYDVVYVPRSALAQAALTMDFIWRIIPLRFNINGNYTLQNWD